MSHHGIPLEKRITQKDENPDTSVLLEVFIPASSDYFDGHFEQFKLMPAVAQVDLVTSYARRYFGVEKSLQDIKRAKFIKPLLPDSTVLFYLSLNDSLLTFKITDKADGSAYASGTLITEKVPGSQEAVHGN